MKLTKFLKSKILLLAILLGGSLIVQSCGGDDDDTPAPVVINKAVLQSTLSSVSTAASSAVEGTAEGQYVYGSVADLQDAITLAQGVLDNANSTQTAIDNTVIALNAALDVFYANAIVPIDPANLVGQWTFDEGSGTTVADFSGNNFSGTFGSVAGFGGGTPEWTVDRYGNDNKAILFDLGAKITVPYNNALNPAVMSISVWIRADENRDSNRFIGLHSWNGYKFQLQSANKSFFTAATSDGIHDRDTDPGLELNTWYHLAVTIGDGNMKFYINGTETKVWDNTPGTMATVADHDLVFGVGSSQYADTTDNYDADKIIPLAWGGYFHGAMDEVRIYKSVLTASQVSSIYDTEKVPN
jgi:Concanavalin A-like lectin/glucanases superfamily